MQKTAAFTIALLLMLVAVVACDEAVTTPTAPAPVVVVAPVVDPELNCLRSGGVWRGNYCERPAPTPEPVVEPESSSIDYLGSITASQSGRHWNVSVTWQPSSVRGDCSWSATGGAYVSAGQQSTGLGRCSATLIGTPSGGDSVAVTVVDAAGRSHQQTASLGGI